MKRNLKNKLSFFLGKIMIASIAVMVIGSQTAFGAITTSLDIGDRGTEVTELQTFLATDVSIYPSGLVTGYFGQLTKAAVERFQSEQGIVSSGTPATTGYGRVGPMTRARINLLLSNDNQAQWDSSPSITTPLVQSTNSSATINWGTNEATLGQIYLSTSPLQFNEATGPRQQPFVSGALTNDDGGYQSNHSVTLQNLQSNTTYYYMVRGIDSAGNMSMVWPRTLRTTQ
ncbi:MAG: hypothetical protein COU06_02350 [Candidatus Harrisonbacteria bacterium CG10_big_fil_rev_8_21_14_0_10_38_8]|uniref:Fibronectin type-III domain-containing protein n=1 Tax=Candidatus Harrisonbacteria bacterium CG10_big_fil_rev_8_21_14_0_10_38_8 TaxID=1974582 RepID=A0A2M6WJN6_9BACT|nr:MAG: hypothetical protein COU06_02350 [Candidatus Harrisonbacteria bacterium CG10_big_fil_rev_8_21_14_0_10_38_8]